MGASSLRLPSPLLSADLPPWMLLHFQIDPETRLGVPAGDPARAGRPTSPAVHLR